MGATIIFRCYQQCMPLLKQLGGVESLRLNYREWEFDYLFNVVNTRWKEQKCPNAYAMPWVADIDWKAKKLKLKPSLR